MVTRRTGRRAATRTHAEGLTCVTRNRGAEKGARTRAVVSAGARARAFIRDTVEKFKNKKIGVLLMLHPVSKITIFSTVTKSRYIQERKREGSRENE